MGGQSQALPSLLRPELDVLLNASEGLGWRLDHISHVYVQTTTGTSSGSAGISVAGVSGHVEAHHIVRRVSAPR